MKITDWLWILWGLAFPVAGLLLFDVTGLIVGFFVFAVYAWLMWLRSKPKEDIEEAGEKAARKLETFSEKMNRMTEAVKADTERRKGR